MATSANYICIQNCVDITLLTVTVIICVYQDYDECALAIIDTMKCTFNTSTAATYVD